MATRVESSSHLRFKPTIEQNLQATLQKVERLRNSKKRYEDGQKMIIGYVVLGLASKDKEIARRLVGWLEDNVQRPKDIARIEPLVERLKGQPANMRHSEAAKQAKPVIRKPEVPDI